MITSNQASKLKRIARKLADLAAEMEAVFEEQQTMDLSHPEEPAAKLVKPTTALWEVYHEEFLKRWRVEPAPRSAKTNGQLATISRQFGVQGGCDLIRHYFQIPDAFYLKSFHDIGLLVSSASRIYGSLKTGVNMTETKARQMDQSMTYREQIAAIDRKEL